MTFGNDAIEALRAAARVSPDNLPLRRHLAHALLALGRHGEAEQEFRAALALAPADALTKTGLAQCYHQAGKASQAMVVVEHLAKRADAPAPALVLYARLLFAAGDTPAAVAQYKRALEQDPAAVDVELGARLGVAPPAAGGASSSPGEAGEYPADDDVEFERPRVTFADVGGMAALKEEISLKIILPLKHPELYRAYGKTAGGGILLYGPPGCGKTHLARAAAGEIQAGFLAVGISDVLDWWLGKSERNLARLFARARQARPSVLFFDEVDALGGKRADLRGGAARQLVNQFLAEMDGVSADNRGVLVLAATNAPWHVDAAFRRPGRFDRVLFAPPPDEAARADILRLHLVGKPQEQIDFGQIAKKTPDFSGADLKGLVDLAVEAKLREAFRAGRPQPLTTANLLAAATTLKPTTREWFAAARNHALYANQGGLYDDVLRYLKMQ